MILRTADLKGERIARQYTPISLDGAASGFFELVVKACALWRRALTTTRIHI
jgi:hypothetical protein